MEIAELEVGSKTYIVRNRNRQMIVRSPVEISPDVSIELERELVAVDESGDAPIKVIIPEFKAKSYTFTRSGASVASIPVTLGGVTLLGYQVLAFVEALTDIVNSQETDTEPPTIPQDLVATALSASSIGLEWSPSTDNIGVQEYIIFRNGARIATTADTSFIVEGLTPETEYGFTVKAKDYKGNTSDASSEVRATTEVAE